MTETELGQLLASLPEEAHPAALRVLQREAARTAPDCLNSGTLVPEERQKNSRRPMDEEVI